MTDEDIVDAFRGLTVWKRGGQRAPHKPLLVLMALARLQAGQPPWTWKRLRPALEEALLDFGTSGRTNAHYPFWRLQRDGVWKVSQATSVELTTAGDPKLGSLDGLDPTGRLAPAIGFPWVVNTWIRRPRDHRFRERVLTIYQRRCAVCGYDGRLGRSELALEAAHIRWHAADGPDLESNGLALCVFHHRSFDRGAWSLADDRSILISQSVTGAVGVQDWLVRFAGRPLREPLQSPPGRDHIKWHRGQVFRGPAR